MSLSQGFKLSSSLGFYLSIKRFLEIEIYLLRSLIYCNVKKNKSGKFFSNHEGKCLGHFAKCFPELKQVHRSWCCWSLLSMSEGVYFSTWELEFLFKILFIIYFVMYHLFLSVFFKCIITPWNFRAYALFSSKRIV